MTPLRLRMIEELRIRNYAEGTQKLYISLVARYARHFATPPDKLGPEHVRLYQLDMLERKVSDCVYRQTVAALRFFYMKVVRRAWVNHDIPYPRAEKRLPVVLGRDEMVRFFKAIPSLKLRTLLMVAYAGGLRVAEVTRLKVTDIDSSRKLIRIEQGKNRKDRYVMLSDQVLAMLRTYWKTARPTTWLFPGRGTDGPITRRHAQLACAEAAKACNLKKKVTPHVLRHSFATHLLEDGVDVRTIQLLMGHRNLTTTSRYLTVSAGEIGKVRSPLDRLAL